MVKGNRKRKRKSAIEGTPPNQRSIHSYFTTRRDGVQEPCHANSQGAAATRSAAATAGGTTSNSVSWTDTTVDFKAFLPGLSASNSNSRRMGGGAWSTLARPMERVAYFNGEIVAESEAGKGALFRVTLPIEKRVPR